MTAENSAGNGAESERIGESGWRGVSGRRVARVAVPVAAAVAVAVIVPLAWVVAKDGGEEERRAKKGKLATEVGTAPEADFDGDGRSDLVIASEFGDYLAVVYGGDGPGGKDGTGDGSGPGEGRRQLVQQKVTGLPARNGDGVGFGRETHTRDLDGDGHTDLIVELSVSPKPENARGLRSGVYVVWGSKDGLRTGEGDATPVRGTPKGYAPDQPGQHALAVGDFDGDGHADLVTRVGGRDGLLRGPFTRDGEPAARGEVPAPKVPEGADLDKTAVGDMNGDGSDDLLTVHAWETPDLAGGKTTSYLAGGEKGFREPRRDPVPGIDNGVLGDVDNDGYADLVMRRHPDGSAPDSAASGPVEVFYGSKEGPEPEESRHTEIDRDTEGVPGEDEEHSDFGRALDAGDVDGDGHADVAVADSGGEMDGDRGSVTLLRGGPDGLTGKGAQRVNRSTGAEPGPPRLRGGFGSAVRLVDVARDGHADLVAGAPNDEAPRAAARLLPGSEDGVSGEAAATYQLSDFGNPPDREDFATGFPR
ncbi:VCBS repeat-containing protein [Streptomyces sp. AJS327]|uniref:FG-GAP and VCBS repeat-containing protein n=1 Tax=Streptomyces sp. AJS327 TaxID=2545265 RepID=UPI0015DF8FA7|nr:FG-GAP and VCBS repeat-containing protein [Streptomyces sp. AJS327]MBA0052128.1 VCBS repeat-containing protein [Streptomyces sp. AJS327]